MLQALASQSDELTRELSKLSSTVSRLPICVKRSTAWTAVQKDSQTTRETTKAHESAFSCDSEDNGEFDALKEDRQLADQLTALGERLGALEERTNVATPNLMVPAETKEIDTYQSGKVLDLRAGLNWEALQPANGKPSRPFGRIPTSPMHSLKRFNRLDCARLPDRFLPRNAPQPSSADRLFSSKAPLLRASHGDLRAPSAEPEAPGWRFQSACRTAKSFASASEQR